MVAPAGCGGGNLFETRPLIAFLPITPPRPSSRHGDTPQVCKRGCADWRWAALLNVPPSKNWLLALDGDSREPIMKESYRVLHERPPSDEVICAW